MNISSERFILETHSTAETEALGERVARSLSVPATLLLHGELGAGKTAFVRGIARGLGALPGVRVTSPTYVLQHAYPCERATLYHIDAYRIRGGAAEFEAGGLMECLDDASGVVCVEWPEKLAHMSWDENSVIVKIEHIAPAVREVSISATGTNSKLVDALANSERRIVNHG
jgi:tRNA threonylcarbamoyladenosine biosynthesis protein TsaE